MTDLGQMASRKGQHAHGPAVRLLAVIFLVLVCPFVALHAAQPAATRWLLLDAAVVGHAVFAVGERGTILHSVDSGETWEQVPTPTSVTLTAISFADPTFGWAVGHEGMILHTRDGGENWTQQFRAPDPETVFLDVFAINASRVIAVGGFGVCYITKDSGRTWTLLSLSDADSHLNRVAATADSELFIVGERGTVLHLPSIIRSPRMLSTPFEGSFYGILPLGREAFLAFGLRGHIVRSADYGSTWQEIASPSKGHFATGVRLRSGLIVLAGQGNAFLLSRDNGFTFTEWKPPSTRAIAELVEAPNGLLLAFGEGGVTRFDPPRLPAE